MDEVSLNIEPTGDDDIDDFEVVGDYAMTEYVGQTGIIQNPLPPAVGMEFETYEDLYYFYNCYAKEQGFGVRVSNTWYRKSKEKYRGKLSCSSAGFKKKSEANRPRPETRTGCPAMIKFRLMENKRWRIIEVELEHNHLIGPASGKFYKSHKHIAPGTKRTLQLDGADEPRCYFEFQLSKLYTNEILRKFEREIDGMYSCFSTRHMNAEGPIVTYIVKEEFEVDGSRRDSRVFDVLYNPSEMEVLCVCGMFNFRGYLCRHILSVLNQNGVPEIPSHYILSRWRKDIKRSYVLDHSCSGIDINNPVHRYDHLYKHIVHVVEEGRKSEDRHKVTIQALDEILKKLHLVEDGQV
ncbi:hypothetical protein Pint_10201 [Pistacia integerrima]|uniref:Uncharacterized protein n=1 Tax=Pistacia integerrima TaxID=434235 RepID=A0ACC0XG79_9ROSI|nr:hypothetical protein Pint_10201 [Pistacia integerrima]